MGILSIEKKLKRALPLEFLLTIVSVFNPNSYEDLSNRTMKNVFSYFFSILFVSYIIMVIVAIPIFVSFESQLNKELSKFDEFIVDVNISMSEPIYLKQIKLGVDATGDKNLTYENILITKNYIQSQPFYCYFKPLCLFGSTKVNKIALDDYKDVVSKQGEYAAWLSLVALFVFPWILMNLFLGLFLKYLIIALFFAGFGLALVRIINRRIKLKRIFKIAIYASTPMIVVNTINIPIGFPLLFIPFTVSFFYFIVGLILASERGFKK